MSTQYLIESFPDKGSAEKAFNIAMDLGYKDEDIVVVMSEEAKKNYYHTKDDAEEQSLKSLALGGVVGVSVGGSIGALIALGTNIAVPGLGLVIAGALMGAGGIYGSLLGTVIGWAIPENIPNPYEEKLRRGEIILIANEHANTASLKQAWAAEQGRNVRSKAYYS